MKKITLRYFFIFLTVALLGFADAAARSYTPDEMEEPNLMAGQYIADPENMLSPSTRSEVNAILSQVRAQTTAEVGVAIVPDMGDMQVEEFANRLYDRWGVGKADKDNGVLLIISPGSRQARIQTGYGTEGVIPDAVADRIMRHEIIPAMREGDLDGAVRGATAEISRILTDPEYAEELKSAQTGYGQNTEVLSAKDLEDIKNVFSILETIIFFCGAVALIGFWLSARKKPRAQKIASYKSMNWLLVALTVLSVGAGIVWLLIGLLMYRHARRSSDPCPNCGNKKRRLLSGSEENQYLTPAQQTEQRLKSRRHEVWKCDNCGLATVDSSDNPFSKYTVCDRCGTKAMHSVGHRTLRAASTFHDGEGEEVYRCEHCGHENRKWYRINRHASQAALGAAALGAARRAVRGGFGGFGGSGGFGGFGGGSSGGGGASGRW